ncbi:MAG: flagellar basal body-associated FliL family protein [Rhizobiales bacterium]|nr:flagellar basal body-associated FliL family protein [Hyphomicrobiales bacterium]NRB13825.1 flagellar basal body-associated FliL family protein [Hyphomicrobiales bacterium]
MAETQDIGDAAQSEDAGEKKGSKKLLFIVVGVVLLLITGGAGAYFMGLFDAAAPVSSSGEIEQPAAPRIEYQYYDLPEMLINLQAGDGQVRFLKLLVSVEYEKGIDAAVIISAKPLIEDLFQTYLRELTPDDLDGSMGVFRLREELLKRINLIIAPEKINGILFKKIVVQ